LNKGVKKAKKERKHFIVNQIRNFSWLGCNYFGRSTYRRFT